MKRIISVCFFVFIFGSAFAQEQELVKKCELGVGVPYFPGLIRNINTVPNISFKYKLKRNYLRSGISFFYYKPNASENRQDLITNIGIEHRFFKKKFKLILGLDLGNVYEKSVSVGNNYTMHNTGFGPVFGGMYQINPKLSVQSELGFFYGYGEEKRFALRKPSHGFFWTTHRAFSLHIYYSFGNSKSKTEKNVTF